MRLREEPDGQVGTRTGEPQRVEAALGEELRSTAQDIDVLLPGGERVRLVEPAGEGDRLPEPIDVGLTEHLLGPAFRRRADGEPGAGLLVDQLHGRPPNRRWRR